MFDHYLKIQNNFENECEDCNVIYIFKDIKQI